MKWITIVWVIIFNDLLKLVLAGTVMVIDIKVFE